MYSVHCTYKLQALVCSYGTIQGEKRIIYIDDFYKMHPRFLTGSLTWTLDPPIGKRKISRHRFSFDRDMGPEPTPCSVLKWDWVHSCKVNWVSLIHPCKSECGPGSNPLKAKKGGGIIRVRVNMGP
jgi:hypothetical protein